MKKYLLIGLLISSPTYANTVNTTSNSTGSVTNQAVQVVPSRQFQSAVGSGIVCQGTTLNISPFVSTTYGFQSPYEDSYDKPVFDNSDANDDGIIDNPGNILYYEPIRTGQKSNTSINGGITATFSIPLDRKQIRLCKEAMEKQVKLYDASLASKRLNYEMSRLGTCAKYFKEGVRFKVGTPMAKICDDVELINPPNTLIEHTHDIPISTKVRDVSPVTLSERFFLPSRKATSPSLESWKLERGSFSR